MCDEARARRSDGVTLTTFREVAWNAPYYRRLGFRALAPEEITPGLAERVRAAEAAGLLARDRVVMRRPVGDATPG